MSRQYSNSQRPKLKYDAYGRPLQNRSSSGFIRFLFGFLFPYVLINGTILCLVIAKPKITAGEPDTRDYKNASIEISVESLLPLKDFSATIEGVNVDISKEGGSYIANVTKNGNLLLTVSSVNGMTDSTHVQVNLLDESPPDIDQESLILEAGYLEFKTEDLQSGVNFDSIYGIDGDGDRVKPSGVNPSTGVVSFSLKSPTIEVHVSDMAGNEITGNFTIN